MTDTIIIGGGAAGCFAAVWAARMGKSVLIFDKNEKLGRKLRITGKGRCNVTNNSSMEEHMKNIPVNPRFMYSAFSAFGAEDVMAFFEELGVSLKTERGNRVFPVSDRADDIADALASEMHRLGVKVIKKRVTKLIIEDGSCCGVCRPYGHRSETEPCSADLAGQILCRANGTVAQECHSDAL